MPPVVLEKTLDEAIKQGEIEGLCWDPGNRRPDGLMNRGARIVLGMGQGYPGYDKGNQRSLPLHSMEPRTAPSPQRR